MKTLFVSVNGKQVKKKEADRYLEEFYELGEGVYEAIQSYHQQLFRLEEHMARFQQSLLKNRLKVNYSNQDISGWCNEAIAAGKIAEQFLILLAREHDIIIICQKTMLNPSFYSEGMKLKTVALDRPNPRTKTMKARMMAATELKKAKNASFDEILLVDHKGKCREGSYSNLFWVRDGRIYTNKNHALPGITQAAIIEAISKKFKVTGGSLEIDELLKQDEVFISSSRLGVAPVCSIDAKKIGTHIPGNICSKVMKLYQQLIDKECKN